MVPMTGSARPAPREGGLMRGPNRLRSVSAPIGLLIAASMLVVTSITAGAAAASTPSAARVISVGIPSGIKRIHPSTDTSPSGKVLELFLHTSGTQGVVAVTAK